MAPIWAQALRPGFTRRLGLTATYERSDNGLERFLTPFFRRVVYRLDYKEALRDDIIAHFKIAFLGVPFAREEQWRYDEANERFRWAWGRLVYEYGLVAEPFGEFIKAVNALAEFEGAGACRQGISRRVHGPPQDPGRGAGEDRLCRPAGARTPPGEWNVGLHADEGGCGIGRLDPPARGPESGFRALGSRPR